MSNSPPSKGAGRPEAIVFDVFGTVVDWRSSVIAASEDLIGAGAGTNWPAFADRWRREGYLEPIGRMVTGAAPWEPIDGVMRRDLDRLAGEFDFAAAGQAVLDDLAAVWSRLDPWPDVTAGLDRLRARYPIGPLSNGSFAGLTRMARHGSLGWDFIISGELFGAYKPDPKTYLGAADLLGVEPAELMLVAAHPLDLQAAARCGLATAYVPRPLEWGAAPATQADSSAFDVVAVDFVALAETLGA